MKTTITITIDTSNIAEVYDDEGVLLDDFSKLIEENIHTTIKNWIKDNVEEGLITNAILSNYYGLQLIDEAQDLNEYGNIKITYKENLMEEEETILNIQKDIITPDMEKREKKLRFEDEEKIPEMQLDDGTDEYSELDEKNENEENYEDEDDEISGRV